MNLFENYTLTWWQIGIFKLALLSIGVAIGAYWSEFWIKYVMALMVVAVVASAYILFVSLSQK